MRRPKGLGGQSPFIFFVSMAQADTALEAEVLVRLVALGNLESGPVPGALCLYDVPRREAANVRGWVERLGVRGVDPSLDLAIEVLPAVPDGAAVLATIVDPDPPYVVGQAAGSLRKGECWVFRGGSLRLASRADLDAAYAGSRRRRPGPDPQALDQLLVTPLEEFKDRFLQRGDRQGMSVLAHRLALQASRVWRRASGGDRADDPLAEIVAAADRVAVLGMVGLSGRAPRVWQASARALCSIYLLSLADAPRADVDRVDLVAPAEEAIARYFLLGALAAHRREWSFVGLLTGESVPGRVRGEFPVADHPLFVPGWGETARTLHDFFDRALQLGRREPAWLEEFGGDDMLVSALCQWDLLAGVASPENSLHYPNFARFEKVRVSPVVALCRREPARLLPVLGEGADRRLERFLELLETEISADFPTFARWWAWGHTFDELA